MRRGLLPLALGSIWIAPGALAQDRSALPPGAVVQPLGDGAASELNRNLAALGQNPRSISALNGAGAAALDMGDAAAAFNFFTRALDADPSSARARAGMAQALVRQERASEALPLFTEAVRMGAPEAEIAADRGLAWDTLGFPARAQADYALSLRNADDPEVRRRLALSLAITGQREEALRVIDPQLRANDRAGWRTQAFILALTGDAAGAGQTARQMMPGAADQLAPFFQRLASLSPSQKALAVHFGRFPSDGRAQTYAQADSAADPGALAMARGSVPMGQARMHSRAMSPLDAAAVRRRPDADEAALSAQIRPAPTRTANASPRRQYSAPSFLEAAGAGEGGPAPQRYASAAQPGSSAPAWPTPVLDERQSNYPSHPPAPPPPPVSLQRPAPNEYQPQNNAQSPGFTLVPQGRPLGRPVIVQPQPQTSFDAVTSAVNALKDEEAGEVADPVEDIAPPVRSQPTRSAPVRQTQATPPRRQMPAPPTNPSRAWVQVATGSNRAGLIFTYGQFRRRAGALLSGRAPYTAPNRLLVGPFPNEAAASSFARQLNARGVPSHSWTSDAGQRIDQLQAAASSDDSPAPTRTRTAANERSSGARNGRGSSSRSERNSSSRNERNSSSRNERNGTSRNERNAGNGSSRNRNGTSSRNERNASNGTGRNRNGSTSGRSGNRRNERSASSSSRTERNGTGRNGRNGTSNSRTASAGSSRNNSNSSRSGTRNSRPTTTASTRSSRGGSGGQSRSSTRRGR